MFQSHPSISIVTLEDGSTSCIFGSWTIHPTSLITLTSIMSLPQFSFNLISVSKLTHALNYSILFFPNYCLIQDLSTKRIIGRGRKSGVSTSLNQRCQRPLLVLDIPFKLHCLLGHLSISLLKNLYPQFSSLSSLNYESCQYDKLHHVHLSPRVNK